MPPPLNGTIHVHYSIMDSVLSSATEAETGALLYNGPKTLCVTLAAMGHPQAVTTIQTDNACATGIVNDNVKQNHSQAMDMHFYWVKDCVA
jgi:hypothetical protein